MSQRKKTGRERVIMVAEKSGGHILPALSLAICEKKNREIYLYTTGRNFERFSLAGVKLIRGNFFSRNLFLEGFYRFLHACYLLAKIRPQIIIGFGGRVSFFLLLLGRMLGRETIIYEPNAVFGRANRFLRFFAKKIRCGLRALGNSSKYLKVGIPLHKNIERFQKKKARQLLRLIPDKPVIFCFGGSQGSSFINQIFRKLVEEEAGHFQIIHLTGKRDYCVFVDFYDRIIKKEYFLKDFFPWMGILYSAADIVICRGGALTLAEISYFKIPAVVIPYPEAGGHQRANALYLERRGGCIVIDQLDFSPPRFKEVVLKLLFDKSFREEIINNLKFINLWKDTSGFYEKFYS